MAGRGAFGLFLLAAAGVHAGALLAIAPQLGGAAAPPGAEDATARVAVADPALAALIEAWNTPPATGEAALLEGPAESAPPPDTATAAEIEAAVAAALALEALGPVSGPGKEAVRPIFAPPPSTSTAPPPTLALRALPDDSALASPLGARSAALSPGLGAPAAPGGGLSPSLGAPSLGPADAGAGFALPDRPDEESFAPETAPLPVPRPVLAGEAGAAALEATGGAGASLLPGAALAAPAPPGAANPAAERPVPALPGADLPGADLPGADLPAPGLLPAGLHGTPVLPYPDEPEEEAETGDAGGTDALGSTDPAGDGGKPGDAPAGGADAVAPEVGTGADAAPVGAGADAPEAGPDTPGAGTDAVPAAADGAGSGPDAGAGADPVALPDDAPVAPPTADAEADPPAGG